MLIGIFQAKRWLVRATLFTSMLGASSNFLSLCVAQDAPTKSETTTDPAALKALIDRINKLEGDVERLKQQAPASDTVIEPQILAMLDVAHLAPFYADNSQTRYLALHVMLANTTKQTFTISQDQVIAEIDGEDRKLKELPRQLLNYTIPSGKQHTQIAAVKPPKEWRLPAGGQTGMWLIYPGLPTGSNVPKCRLKIKLGETTKEINVNELQRAQLSLDVQRIGPRECLALLTIGGSMNTFNAGAFVDELDALVEKKVARVVVRWNEGATPPDQPTMQWLMTAAVGNGGNPNHNANYPVIPAAIREFHLTEFPSGDDAQSRNGLRPTSPSRVHKTTTESVGAALRTAYLSLPRDELFNEIQKGNPLTRPAALAFGGGRLDVDKLPQIFEWAEDQDPELQKSAIQALSHFGEASAIEKLVYYAKRNVEPISSSAIESLAGSRFGAAHEALLELLKNEPASSKKKIIQVLAKYPRSIWSDTLYEFVTNSSGGADADSIRALIQVGHPQLVDVLERSLKSAEKPIRDQAFQELSKRSDERSEKLAVGYALKALEAGPPDDAVVQLLSRTKDPRAIPMLLKQLDSNHDRVNVINLLMQLGDQEVADRLVQKYSSLNNNEKVQILQGLKAFRHPKFRELCGEALLTNDNQLVTAAATALSQEGHVEGEKFLIAALEKQKPVHLLGNIVNALANYGTATARDALIRARDSGDKNKHTYASQALLTMRQRSPGYQYVYQARTHQQSNQIKEELEAYEMALQLDSELPEAYWGRGELFLKQQKYSAARKDLEKVLELKLDLGEREGDFITSLAIARICDGQVLEGLKYLEENRGRFVEGTREPRSREKRYFYLYNAACAYSRAFEYVQKQTELPDREALREKYRKQAIVDLTESFQRGFEDYAHAAKDPDFESLREDPEFKKILAGRPSEKPADKSEEKSERDDE
ncbi:HEAT repeat domain-containing protein [Schlesneria paludicola]|uniref:HEAT repeat domain-containing protein n=1 Tax=Schlesneria paludicola TaxID=360056 RepID=UPI00029A76A8|nr:HEAT repeat domain-containing protein [Schlesneria paludicola]